MHGRRWLTWVIVICTGCSLESRGAPPLPVPDASAGSGGSGGSSAGSGGSAGSSGSGGGKVDIHASSEGTLLRTQMTVRNVAFGEEGHLCADVQLTNDEAVWVTELRATIGNGSHHMIVNRTGTTVADPEARECFALLGGDESRLVIAQQAETRFTLPAEAGFLIQPHEVVTMQIHFINTAGGSIDVTGSLELVTQPRSTELLEARVVFTGGFGLSLPPNSPSSSDFFTPVGSPGAPLRVFGLTSHTHHLGVRSTIRRQASEGETGELLHESLNWAEPPQTTFDPVLVFDGSDGLALRCEYINTTDQFVTFGTGFNDEMCFMWMYAY